MNKINKSYIYGTLDVCITLRCNQSCPSCIKLCNMKKRLNIDYSDSDMTIQQIYDFIDQVKSLGKNSIKRVCITGGEPLLHKDVAEITKLVEEQLLNQGYIGRLKIISNGSIIPRHDIKKYMKTATSLDKKKEVHVAFLKHPDELGLPRATFNNCTSHRKHRIVLTKYGYNYCCGADGLIRLFGLDELILNYLPTSPNMFPLHLMDRVCQHCIFGCFNEKKDSPPILEKDLGNYTSDIFLFRAK